MLIICKIHISVPTHPFSGASGPAARKDARNNESGCPKPLGLSAHLIEKKHFEDNQEGAYRRRIFHRHSQFLEPQMQKVIDRFPGKGHYRSGFLVIHLVVEDVKDDFPLLRGQHVDALPQPFADFGGGFVVDNPGFARQLDLKPFDVVRPLRIGKISPDFSLKRVPYAFQKICFQRTDFRQPVSPVPQGDKDILNRILDHLTIGRKPATIVVQHTGVVVVHQVEGVPIPHPD